MQNPVLVVPQASMQAVRDETGFEYSEDDQSKFQLGSPHKSKRTPQLLYYSFALGVYLFFFLNLFLLDFIFGFISYSIQRIS